jgi:hypothetical protein
MNTGTLCILRDGQQEAWSVWMCHGFGERQRLAGFEDRAAAADFALSEADRLHGEGWELQVHLPDDCPCYPEHERRRCELKLDPK